jgi:hypothetical protein
MGLLPGPLIIPTGSQGSDAALGRAVTLAAPLGLQRLAATLALQAGARLATLDTTTLDHLGLSVSVGSLGGDVGASVRAVAKAGRFDLERAQRTFKDVGVLIFDHPTRGRELGIALSADAIDTDRKVMVGEHWHAGLGLASSKEDWGGSPGSPSSPLVSDLRHHRANPPSR